MADKKLFGQAEDNNPPLSDKIAFGTETNNARTMTFTNLLAWLEGKLGFFKTSNNLSEANAAQVRTNIDVNSTSEITTLLSSKANTSDVLVKGGTTPYTPTTIYSPTTVEYVENILKRNKGGFVNGYVLDIPVLISGGDKPTSFSLLNTTGNDGGVLLPTAAQLDSYFGYHDGVVFDIICHPNSTRPMYITGSLLDSNGGANDHVMAQGDSVRIMYVSNSNATRKYMMLNISA